MSAIRLILVAVRSGLGRPAGRAVILDDEDDPLGTGAGAVARGLFLAGRDIEAAAVDITVVVERIEIRVDRMAARIADAGRFFDPDFHRISPLRKARARSSLRLDYRQAAVAPRRRKAAH